MKRKRILIIGIVILITVVALGISGCQRKPISVPTEEEAEGQEELKKEIAELKELEDKEIRELKEESQKGIEAEKLQKIDSLLTSEAIQWVLSANGIVQEIEGRNLSIVGLTEKGEETSFLVVPVSQEAKIISDYILPEGAAKEEIIGTISTARGKEYNLGEKEISLEEIKVGDNVYISLNLRPEDYSIEGTWVWVSPVDLFDF